LRQPVRLDPRIVVGRCDDLAPGGADAGVERGVAALLRLVEIPQRSRKRRAFLIDNGPRVIGRLVVGDDELPLAVDGQLRNAANGLAEFVRAIVGRDDDREVHIAIGACRSRAILSCYCHSTNIQRRTLAEMGSGRKRLPDGRSVLDATGTELPTLLNHLPLPPFPAHGALRRADPDMPHPGDGLARPLLYRRRMVFCCNGPSARLIPWFGGSWPK
jgi:hypothetical protein